MPDELKWFQIVASISAAAAFAMGILDGYAVPNQHHHALPCFHCWRLSWPSSLISLLVIGTQMEIPN